MKKNIDIIFEPRYEPKQEKGVKGRKRHTIQAVRQAFVYWQDKSSNWKVYIVIYRKEYDLSQRWVTFQRCLTGPNYNNVLKQVKEYCKDHNYKYVAILEYPQPFFSWKKEHRKTDGLPLYS